MFTIKPLEWNNLFDDGCYVVNCSLGAFRVFQEDLVWFVEAKTYGSTTKMSVRSPEHGRRMADIIYQREIKKSLLSTPTGGED